ncbi:MAG: N-acetylmuramoyl-L-alanine amidase, partial [Eubacteriales bacterium]
MSLCALLTACAPAEPPTTTTGAPVVVCIDAGHGGDDPGANGATFTEKEITLAVALRLEAALRRQGFAVVMTRTDDTMLSLHSRCRSANEAGAAAFVSLHVNSAADAEIGGSEVFYSSENKQDSDFARAVYEGMLAAVPLRGRGVKPNDFFVLVHTEAPAVLCELAFVTREAERQMLLDPACQEQWAQGICQGLCRWFSVPFR